MKTIIAAAPGYAARYWEIKATSYFSEPIIAWRIDDDGKAVYSEAIGVDGLLDSANAILHPDGRVSWVEHLFNNVDECMKFIRENGKKT